MITQQRLHELFDYDASGGLRRKEVNPQTKHLWGKLAGSLDKQKGYYRIEIDQKNYYLHRMIFLYHTGQYPEMVDHIDNNPLNNTIENLREATRHQNTQNAKLSKANSTGVKGVTQYKDRFRAYCTANGKRNTLGTYATLEEAAEVVRKFREQNHSSFANHG